MKEPPFKDWDNPDAEDFDVEQPRQTQQNISAAKPSGFVSGGVGGQDGREKNGGVGDKSNVTGSIITRDVPNSTTFLGSNSGSMQQGTAAVLRSLPRELHNGTSQTSLDAAWQRISGISSSLAVRDDLSNLRVSAIQLPSLKLRSSASNERDPEIVRLLEEQAREIQRQKDHQDMLQQQLQLQAQGQQAQLMQLLLVQQHQLQQQMTSMASMQAANGMVHPGSFPSPSSYSVPTLMPLGAMPSPQGPGGLLSPGAFMTPGAHAPAGTRDLPRYPQHPSASGQLEQRQLYEDINATTSSQGLAGGTLPGSLASPPSHGPAGMRDMPQHLKPPPGGGLAGEQQWQAAVSLRDAGAGNLHGSLASPPNDPLGDTRDSDVKQPNPSTPAQDSRVGSQPEPNVLAGGYGPAPHPPAFATQGSFGSSKVVKLGATPHKGGDVFPPNAMLSVADEHASVPLVPSHAFTSPGTPGGAFHLRGAEGGAGEQERLSLLAPEASSDVRSNGGSDGAVKGDPDEMLPDASFSHLRDLFFAILFMLNLCVFVLVGIAALDAKNFYTSRRLMMRHHHRHHRHLLRRHMHRHLLGMPSGFDDMAARDGSHKASTAAQPDHLNYGDDDDNDDNCDYSGGDFAELRGTLPGEHPPSSHQDTAWLHGSLPYSNSNVYPAGGLTWRPVRRSLLSLAEPGWYEELAPMLLASATIGISLGFLWLTLVRFLPRFCLRLSLALPVLVFAAAVAALLTSERWAEGAIAGVCMLVSLLYVVTVRRYIAFSCELLASGAAALSSFPSVTAHAYWTAVLQLLWLALVALVTCVVKDAWGYFPLIYVAASYFWVSEVIKNVLHVGAAGVVGMWYFNHQPVSAGGHVVQVAFRRARRPLFGCACFGSLLMSAISTLRTLTVFARWLVDRNGHACVRAVCCCLTCGVATLETLIARFNKYGLAQAALKGTPFVASSRAAWALMTSADAYSGQGGARGVALENANLVDGVIQMAAVVTGVLAAMGGSLWANELFDGRDKLGEKTVSTFIGCFLVAYTLVETWLQLVSAACNGLLISLLTSPGHLAAHGNKAVGGLRAAWQTLFGVALGGEASVPLIVDGGQALELASTAPPAPQAMVNDGVVRKRAVLFGLNYRGQNGELNGCINDVAVQKQMLLTKYGFPESCIRVLTDDTPEKPTLDNIRKNLQWLRSVPGEGWTLFLHYSGHGTQVPDEDGDEEDGMDEALVPLDFEATGQALTDDQLRKSLFDQIPHGARLYAFFDCCHSGTMSDLKEVQAKLGAAGSHGRDEKAGGRFLPPSEAAKQRIEELAALRRKQHAEGSEESKPGSKLKIPKLQKVVVLSGCRDDQTAADAFINGKYAGATTWALQQVLDAAASKGAPHISLISLINGMNEKLQKGGYTQEAKLSVGDIDPTKDAFLAE